MVAKIVRPARKGWDETEKLRLRGLWEGGAFPEDVAQLLGRSVEAVREMAKACKYRRPAWYLAMVRAAAARAGHESRIA